ncbi:hypothetical protein PVAG01_07290 [Phlyctema vagabunda]|uniref:Uncharacterized protein n=1 Tax=Phlyctema vagabunda TaxID=108571 RepID=A0ABR4PC30_9HELO
MYELSQLEKCAEQISSASRTISLFSIGEGKPQPSFSPEAPAITITADAPKAVLAARRTLIDAALKVQQLVTEPAEYIPNLQIHYQHLTCIRWLCHFNVLACIPLHNSVPYFNLASISGVPESQLRSVARMAMTSNFLSESKPGEVAHNAVSRTFVTNSALVDWALFVTQSSMPAAAKFVEATEKWGSMSKKNETAVNIAMDTNLPLFDFISQSPEMTQQFIAYMKNVQTSEGTHIRHLVAGYNWASLKDSIVVDVSNGIVSQTSNVLTIRYRLVGQNAAPALPSQLHSLSYDSSSRTSLRPSKTPASTSHPSQSRFAAGSRPAVTTSSPHSPYRRAKFICFG